jgi:hypothetical protein
MPGEAVVLVIVEHPANPDLLFAGIHNGLMVSTDGGQHWVPAGGNLPPVSVNDIKIKDGDLVLGTYGRGIIILDDIAFLANLDEEAMAEGAYLFPVRDAEQHYLHSMNPANRAARFAGPNPDYGALITYYLEEGSAGGSSSGESEVAIQILDRSGTVIRELTGPMQSGFNRVAWDLRVPSEPETPAGGQGRRRQAMNDVDPGQYTVKLVARGLELTQAVRVVPDKRR